jgi:hypothetical protein
MYSYYADSKDVLYIVQYSKHLQYEYVSTRD